MRLWFFWIDLLLNLLAGALVGVLAVGLIETGWNMFLAMCLGMIAGMLGGMLGAVILTPVAGAMEVILPLMLSGMIAGMAVAMLESMYALTYWHGAEIGCLFGVAGFTYCQLADYLLRGDTNAWRR